jgi:hypothetical protein
MSEGLCRGDRRRPAQWARRSYCRALEAEAAAAEIADPEDRLVPVARGADVQEDLAVLPVWRDDRKGRGTTLRGDRDHVDVIVLGVGTIDIAAIRGRVAVGIPDPVFDLEGAVAERQFRRGQIARRTDGAGTEIERRAALIAVRVVPEAVTNLVMLMKVAR